MRSRERELFTSEFEGVAFEKGEFSALKNTDAQMNHFLAFAQSSANLVISSLSHVAS